MRAFKVMPKALRILAKKLTHLACNSRPSGNRVGNGNVVEYASIKEYMK